MGTNIYLLNRIIMETGPHKSNAIRRELTRAHEVTFVCSVQSDKIQTASKQDTKSSLRNLRKRVQSSCIAREKILSRRCVEPCVRPWLEQTFRHQVKETHLQDFYKPLPTLEWKPRLCSFLWTSCFSLLTPKILNLNTKSKYQIKSPLSLQLVGTTLKQRHETSTKHDLKPENQLQHSRSSVMKNNYLTLIPSPA